MSIVFHIGEGDTSPTLDFLVQPATRILTGASATFRWRPVGTTTWANEVPATIPIPTVTPTLRHTWQAGQTNSPGLFEGQFVVTYADLSVETFPNNDFITISVFGIPAETSEKIANVRFLVGDTENLLSSRDILFALDQNSNVYAAAAICARALAARYARRVNTRFETVWADYGQLSAQYEKLARQLDMQAKRFGSIGLPVAGGISRADNERVEAMTDRAKPFFRDNLHSNPPNMNE
jgi:hypothetical protein